jgi:hypothetical protein
MIGSGRRKRSARVLCLGDGGDLEESTYDGMMADCLGGFLL